MREVWVSKKKWTLLEKRIADLEVQVQRQLTVNVKIVKQELEKYLKNINRSGSF